MTDYQTLNARQLRTEASKLGVAGASRMTKDEILAAIATKDPSNRRAGTMTRGERDSLHRRTFTLYHPAQNLDDHDRKSKRSLSRYYRRHTVHTRKTLGGVETWTTNVDRRYRQAGVMVPVTRRDLFNAAARLPKGAVA